MESDLINEFDNFSNFSFRKKNTQIVKENKLTRAIIDFVNFYTSNSPIKNNMAVPNFIKIMDSINANQLSQPIIDFVNFYTSNSPIKNNIAIPNFIDEMNKIINYSDARGYRWFDPRGWGKDTIIVRGGRH